MNSIKKKNFELGDLSVLPRDIILVIVSENFWIYDLFSFSLINSSSYHIFNEKIVWKRLYERLSSTILMENLILTDWKQKVREEFCELKWHPENRNLKSTNITKNGKKFIGVASGTWLCGQIGLKPLPTKGKRNIYLKGNHLFPGITQVGFVKWNEYQYPGGGFSGVTYALTGSNPYPSVGAYSFISSSHVTEITSLKMKFDFERQICLLTSPQLSSEFKPALKMDYSCCQKKDQCILICSFLSNHWVEIITKEEYEKSLLKTDIKDF